MPSARSTLAIVAAALVYGTSVLAVPTENSYDLAERDYSDVAELDARMYDMDLEEYYVREGEATPAVATAPTTPVHAHKHKGHHHKPGYKSLRSYSHVTPPPSPYTATSKLSTREPKHGKGRGGKGRKGRGRKGKGHKGKKGGAPPAEAAAAPADSYAEPPAARDLEADDEMLSAREPKGGKGRGGKGRRHRGHKGHKGKGRKAKGGAPPAEAAAAPADAPAEAPAARDVADADEMISAREPKSGKRHGHKGKGKGKGRKGKGRKSGKGKKAAAAAAPAEAAPADAYAAAEPPVARALSDSTVTDEKVIEKTPSPTADATSPAPVHKIGRAHV